MAERLDPVRTMVAMKLSSALLIASLAVSIAACTVGQDGSAGDGGAFDATRESGASDAGGLDATVRIDAAPPRDAAFPDAGDRPCMAEVCSNGLDDDCNGAVDDTCTCVPGDTMSCFRGAPAHRSRGICVDGTMICSGFEFGAWEPCVGDVLEGEEVCDADGLDEDCDGAPNDGCECGDGDPPLPCGSDVGECVAGVQRCEGGMLTACEGATGALAETCDGADEDCDGAIDEGLTRTCGMSVGRCLSGIATCTAGVWGTCEGEVLAGTETCDGSDEDCDGSTDESTDRACGSDTGECAVGLERCELGAYAACSGAIEATSESCNARDDDCDGAVDERIVRPCGSDVGVCVAGTQTCSAGTFPTACSGEVVARAEACDGTLDDDCDGAVDEGCGCTSGTMRACGTDVGACRAGSQTCSPAGTWGTCTGAIDPASELCNGVDDDCDGLTDEGCDCITGATRSCGIDTGECARGTETCDAAGDWGACAGSIGPATEVCNTRDDDCDGLADEDGVCPRFPPLAMCPAPRTTVAGTGVTLVGMGSDPDGGGVTFAWSVVARPGGSSASPSPPTSASTSFTPDAAGDYTLRLCVTDDESVTVCCTTTVTATASCTVPATPTATSCATSWDRRPIVELTPLPSGIVYELFVDGAAAPFGTVTSPMQN
jgi:hypothetical protein